MSTSVKKVQRRHKARKLTLTQVGDAAGEILSVNPVQEIGLFKAALVESVGPIDDELMDMFSSVMDKSDSFRLLELNGFELVVFLVRLGNIHGENICRLDAAWKVIHEIANYA